MRFSNPLSSRREYGSPSGSAQTRSTPCRGALAPAVAATSRPTAAAAILRKAKDIKHAALGRAPLEIAHDIGESTGRGGVACIEVPGNYRARPAADARQDGDV